MFSTGDEIRGAAGFVLVLARFDRLGHRDDVRRTARLHQARDVAPDAPVVVAVEVVGRDDVGDAIERLVVDEKRAEQRLLRLHRMRRKLEREKLRICAFRARYLLVCNGHLFVTSPGPPS